MLQQRRCVPQTCVPKRHPARLAEVHKPKFAVAINLHKHSEGPHLLHGCTAKGSRREGQEGQKVVVSSWRE